MNKESHIRVKTEVWKHLESHPFTANEMRVLLCIHRNTSYSIPKLVTQKLISEETNIKKQNVCRTIKKLKEQNFVKNVDDYLHIDYKKLSTAPSNQNDYRE